MARTVHTTASERENMKGMIVGAGGTPEQAEALSAAVEAIAMLDVDLREWKGAVHNTLVVAHRDPAVKQARNDRGLAIAKDAKARGHYVVIAMNVKAGLGGATAEVLEVTDKGDIIVKSWMRDGRVRLAGSQIGILGPPIAGRTDAGLSVDAGV